jgi:hypothetical protein
MHGNCETVGLPHLDANGPNILFELLTKDDTAHNLKNSLAQVFRRSLYSKYIVEDLLRESAMNCSVY